MLFEFYKLCNEYEKLDLVERGLLLTEKSVSVLAGVKRIDVRGIDPVETLVAFIMGSIVSDGAVDERHYLYIYPSLVKAFGNDFDFAAIKRSFQISKDIRKEVSRRTKDLMRIVGNVDDALKRDIITLCLLTCSVDGKISLKEKRYVRQLLRA